MRVRSPRPGEPSVPSAEIDDGPRVTVFDPNGFVDEYATFGRLKD